MMHRSRGTRRARAFSLVELLVVIALFVVLLLIGVPAFRSLLEASDENMAENAMRGGILAARDAAARGGQGQDAAAVFFYDAVTQKASIIPCVLAGTLLDVDSGNNDVVREVFMPINGFEPTQLPRGWMPRGYAVPNLIDDDWYGDAGTPYATQSVRQQGNWLFPETDFYDWTVEDDGRDRQTFMIRFEGGTGAVKPGESGAVLVVLPAPTDDFRTSAPFNTPAFRIDTAIDPGRVVRNILNAPFSGAGSLSINQRRELLGDESSDTVLAKPVRMVALCHDERGLAPYLNARLDRATGSIYQNYADPLFVANIDLDLLNEYILGADLNGLLDPQSRARIFAVHRYLGTLQEMTGSLYGQGVGQ